MIFIPVLTVKDVAGMPPKVTDVAPTNALPPMATDAPPSAVPVVGRSDFTTGAAP